MYESNVLRIMRQ